MATVRRLFILALAMALGSACGIVFPSHDGAISADDVKAHAEAHLVYPGATFVAWFLQGEKTGGTFVNTGPTAAYGEVDFHVSDPVDRVVAWYDAWLSSHGWLDGRIQGDGDRRWERQTDEDFILDCEYQDATYRACLAHYTLRSQSFPPVESAAPAFGSPVQLAAVQKRQVGLAATEDRVFYQSGRPLPRDGTPGADAARAKWSTGWCCATPVVLKDTTQPEQATPLRSAYRLIVLVVAEYDRPDVAGGAFGSIERHEVANLTSSGFVRTRSGASSLFVRGEREAVIFSIAYGSAMVGGQATRYRVATVTIVYDVASASCELSSPACVTTLFGVAT